MSTLADCPSKRCPCCQLSSMSWGDDLAVITATSNSLCAWDSVNRGKCSHSCPTLQQPERENFLLYFEQKVLSFVWIDKQHWAGSDDEHFSLPVALRNNSSWPRHSSKPGLSIAHNSTVSPLAFACPLHPLPYICESSSLTPNSLLTLFWLLLFFSTSAKPFLSSYLAEILSFPVGSSDASPPAFTALCWFPSTVSPKTLNSQVGHVWNYYYGSANKKQFCNRQYLAELEYKAQNSLLLLIF